MIVARVSNLNAKTIVFELYSRLLRIIWDSLGELRKQQDESESGQRWKTKDRSKTTLRLMCNQNACFTGIPLGDTTIGLMTLAALSIGFTTVTTVLEVYAVRVTPPPHSAATARSHNDRCFGSVGVTVGHVN